MIVFLLLTTGCAGGAGTPASAPRAASPGPVTGFRVSHDHHEMRRHTAVGKRIDWTTTWTLSWEDVPGARSYAVWYATTEGGGDTDTAPDVRVAEPAFDIEAAAGTSVPRRLDIDRSTTLSMSAGQLLVAVAAIGAKGATGEPSRFFPVGEVPGNSVPIGHEVGEGHGHH